MKIHRRDASRLALAVALAAAPIVPAAAQQVIVVPAGTTDATPKIVGGTDSVTVQAGGTLSTPVNPTINWATSSTDLRITNSGVIRSTATGGRAINASGAGNARTVTLVNNAGGLIESQDDAFRINVAPTSGAIRVDNFGVIRTTVGGQALDFDAVTGGATIVINNFAGAELRSIGQDAIRPGQGAVVTNAGLIQSDGAANNSYDGVDWQGRSGVVVNQAGGTISGLRHGITSDVAVNVTNAGTILGRNGSGIGSDGTGTVVNTGTITGAWDGVATNGDGDGVDIDFIGSVVNSGTIQGLSAVGVDSGGRPNSAEGIAMGGGTIVNNAGATIFGAGNAVLINHDINPGGVADGATTLTNAGTIRATTGRAISFVGAFADTITNSGTITGGAAGAIDMGDGDDTLALLTGSVITGAVVGGAGNDRVTLGGTGSGSLAGATGFETLAVNGGNWTLTGASTFSNGVAINAGGRLVLAASLPSAVAVASGGTLGGVGTVASIAVASGGSVAPGAGIGALTTTGGFSQGAGSTYLAETTAAGASDRIVVGGAATIAGGAQLVVSRDGGAYAIGTRYTLLTAAGGVSGTYTLVQTASGGTEFRLGQAAGSVFVDVARTAASLSGLARTANQAAVAPAIAALGVGNAGYAALTLIPDDDAARRGFDALSGEIHASVRTGMVMDARATQGVVRARLTAPVDGSGMWAQGVRRGGGDDGVAGAAASERRGWGGVGGIDVGMGGARAGIAGGYTRTTLDVGARSSDAALKTTQALGYVGGAFGGFALRAGVGYAWVKTEVDRNVAFTGFASTLTARYDGNVLHGFAEAGVALPALGGTIEPFAGVAAYRVKTDAFVESGGAAALAGTARSEDFTLSSLGLRGQTPIVTGVSARTSLAWEHVLDKTAPTAALRFAGTALPFTVTGTGLSKDAAAFALDLDWKPAGGVTLTAGYNGMIGGRNDDSSVRVGAAISF